MSHFDPKIHLHKTHEAKLEQLATHLDAELEGTWPIGNTDREIINIDGGPEKELPVHTQWARIFLDKKEG